MPFAFGQAILDWVYPKKCALCGQWADVAICSTCKTACRIWEPAPTAGKSALAESHSVFAYEGRAAQAVQRLKYERVTSLAAPMATILEDFRSEHLSEDLDVIIPVPIHWSRRCFRGFNQSEMLCEAMPSSHVNRRLLIRKRATRPQVVVSREERAHNLSGAFHVVGDVAKRRILLVDDVTTSGHTAEECARTLLSSGASSVKLLTFAAGG